eukprot:GHVP01028996.1.p1 GENE.GHVP01028996.1~~GHVP01028996.1.p1  ORF type:complete len:307 (-),score=63.44 GHVP01028996.1:58-978(-)
MSVESIVQKNEILMSPSFFSICASDENEDACEFIPDELVGSSLECHRGLLSFCLIEVIKQRINQNNISKVSLLDLFCEACNHLGNLSPERLAYKNSSEIKQNFKLMFCRHFPPDSVCFLSQKRPTRVSNSSFNFTNSIPNPLEPWTDERDLDLQSHGSISLFVEEVRDIVADDVIGGHKYCVCASWVSEEEELELLGLKTDTSMPVCSTRKCWSVKNEIHPLLEKVVFSEEVTIPWKKKTDEYSENLSLSLWKVGPSNSVRIASCQINVDDPLLYSPILQTVLLRSMDDGAKVGTLSARIHSIVPP